MWEKDLRTFNYPFVIEILIKVRKGEFFSLLKDICEESIANIMLNDERLNAFSVKLVTRQERLHSQCYSILDWRPTQYSNVRIITERQKDGKEKHIFLICA